MENANFYKETINIKILRTWTRIIAQVLFEYCKGKLNAFHCLYNNSPLNFT